jgi:large subunit ribosomal protein L17
MNQAEVNKLVSALKFAVRGRHRQIRNPDGSEGRLFKMRKIVTAMLKYERLELNFNKADEARGYAERVD